MSKCTCWPLSSKLCVHCEQRKEEYLVEKHVEEIILLAKELYKNTYVLTQTLAIDSVELTNKCFSHAAHFIDKANKLREGIK